MRKLTDEQKAWLMSEGAAKLRGHFANQAKLSVDALISAAMASTDPTVRGHAMAFATWKAAHEEVKLPNESD